VIVVAEGARPVGGEPVYLQGREVGGAPRLGGIGEVLAGQLQECCDLEVRVTVLGHLQRGGSPTAFDRLLSSRFGTMAVHMAAQGRLGTMVALQGQQLVPVPIAEAVSRQKLVPLDSDLLLTAFGLGISLGNSREAIAALQKEAGQNA
jgi:6-phosphofructokinase 1